MAGVAGARSESLTLIERLSTDFTRVIHAHQSGSMFALPRAQLGLFMPDSRRGPRRVIRERCRAAGELAQAVLQRAQLLGPLNDADRRLLIAAVGFDEPPRSRRALEELLGDDELEERLRPFGIVDMQRTGRVALPSLDG